MPLRTHRLPFWQIPSPYAKLYEGGRRLTIAQNKMAIDQSDIQKVRAAVDTVAIIGEHTALKRVGRRWVGLCPFHNESTPSFTVSEEFGLYHCFGCQASGDIINFICEIDGINFLEALQRLAAKAGITLQSEDYESRQKRSRWRDLSAAISTAVDFYHEQLLHSDPARKARQYLRQRGYTSEIVSQFKLGYAPPSSHNLSTLLTDKIDQAVEIGLISAGNYSGEHIDIFRDRVIFPIFDTGGNPIAIGGRILPENFRTITTQVGPKYRNTKESPIYSKSRVLYGLNFSKKEISHQDRVIVCEGYTDVIAFYQIGENISVATCGTALTEHHIKTLSNFTKKIILSFDADLAGQEAMARLYGWEEKHQVSLLVTKLPPGSDPAELALANPELLKKIVDEAQPYLGFLVARAVDKIGTSHPEERAKAAQNALLVISSHPNKLIRDEYLSKVADSTRLPISDLRTKLEKLISDSAGKNASDDRKTGRYDNGIHSPFDKAEKVSGNNKARTSYSSSQKRVYAKTDSRVGVNDQDISAVSSRDEKTLSKTLSTSGRKTAKGPISGEIALLFAVHHPDLMAGELTETLFTDDLQKRVFLTLADSDSLMDAIENSAEDVQDYLYRLSTKDLPDGADVNDTLSSLCALAVETEIREILAETRITEDTDLLEQASREITFAKTKLEVIRSAQADGVYRSSAITARGELVDWLCDRRSNDRR